MIGPFHDTSWLQSGEHVDLATSNGANANGLTARLQSAIFSGVFRWEFRFNG